MKVNAIHLYINIQIFNDMPTCSSQVPPPSQWILDDHFGEGLRLPADPPSWSVSIFLSSNELFAWAPKSYWVGFQEAIRLGSKELYNDWSDKQVIVNLQFWCNKLDARNLVGLLETVLRWNAYGHSHNTAEELTYKLDIEGRLPIMTIFLRWSACRYFLWYPLARAVIPDETKYRYILYSWRP